MTSVRGGYPGGGDRRAARPRPDGVRQVVPDQVGSASISSNMIWHFPRRVKDRGHRLRGWLDRGVDDQVVAIPWLVFTVQDLLPARQRKALDIYLAGPHPLAVHGLVRADELDFEQPGTMVAGHGAPCVPGDSQRVHALSDHTIRIGVPATGPYCHADWRLCPADGLGGDGAEPGPQFGACRPLGLGLDDPQAGAL